jgi:hypothetical protein
MFRRKKATEDQVSPDPATDPTEEAPEDEVAQDPRARGPWDATEVRLDDPETPRLDLGSLLVTPREGLEVQVQVDEPTGQVVAVVVAAEDGAVELRAFAAPRNGDIWEGVRRAVAGEVAQMGGTATEVDGPYGTELQVFLTVDLGDGQLASQPSRVVGVSGPRWLLRATLFGRPAVQPDPDGDLEQALRDVVVVRGTNPVPPGDALPLTLPPDAVPTEGGPGLDQDG